MRPPRFARLVLGWLLPRADRDVARGDLDEEFRRHVLPARGRAAARRWYWRQVIGTVPHAVRRRAAPVLTHVPADARHALRMWRRHPAFAGAAIVTQAIGIAVATAVFGVAHSVLLRPLPYAEPERLVQILEGAEGRGLLSYPDVLDLRRANRAFEEVAGFNGGSRTLALPGMAPDRVAAISVTDGFFDVLGVPMLAGRGFSIEDVHAGAPDVVVLAHGAWLRRFGGDPAALGRQVTLNGQPHTIIGILPASFEFPLRGRAELWLPERPSQLQQERGYWHWMDVIGRRRAGLSPAQIEADLQAVAAVFTARDPKFHETVRLRVEPLRDVIVGRLRPAIEALLAGVGLLLLATCATMAGMLLSRASGRVREMAMRAALGARRGRLVQQLLVENLMLSLAGGAAGLVIGHWLLQSFIAIVPSARLASWPHAAGLGLNPPVAAAAVLLSLATGLLFGVIPAMRASRAGAPGALHGLRATSGRGEGRLRFALAGLQVAVALVLLAGAALLGTSVYRLLHVSPGFNPDGLITMRLSLPERYRNSVDDFMDRLLERLEAIPAATGAAAINQGPLTGLGNTGTLAIVERPEMSGDSPPDVGLRRVTPNYFSVMGIPVVRGRAFTHADSATSPKVVLINQRLAGLLAAEDPIGEHVTFEFSAGPWEIVGIVGDERFDHLDQPLVPVVYFPARQDPMGAFTLVVRTRQPATLPAAARAAVAALDPELPLFDVRTIDEITAESSAVFVRRAAVWVLAVFAVTAVLLATMALYGVLAQAVSERTREIGIRLALGATRASIFTLVLRRGLMAAAAGIVAGVGGAILASRALTSLLFGGGPAGPLAIAASAVFIAAVAVIACLVPAARAVAIEPASAIRVE
ncbi:MAG: ADOP family duplicated permease [Vicinamibacterales bacterium]